jgi:hypothetical protein
LRWFVTANVVAIIVVAALMRVWRLDHVPGMNGDEAWMGVQALRWIDGDAVDWWTPTGNPINFFHFIPQVILHSIADPSVALLRLTVLISGILALQVNYFFCLRTFGRRTATTSTVVLAILPVNIASSRFAWDASQTVLFTIPVIYFSLWIVMDHARRWRWLIAAVLGQLAALIVHPTNIFVAPFVFIAAGCSFRQEIQRWLAATKIRWTPRLICAIALVATIGGGMLAWPKLVLAARRLVSPGQYVLFAQRFVDLLSGTSVYQYLAGSQLDEQSLTVRLYRLASWLVVALVAYGAFQVGRQRRATLDRLFISCFAVVTGVFFLIAGPEAAEPHSHRYAMCLIAPATILIAISGRWWIARLRIHARTCAVAVAWGLLLGFYTNYFSVFDQTGGESHRTFRTSQFEPKLAAAAFVAGQDDSQPRWIVASEWWTYWPLAYLLHQDRSVCVVGSVSGDVAFGEHDASTTGNQEHQHPVFELSYLRRGLTDGRVFIIEFDDTKTADSIDQQLSDFDLRVHCTKISDRAGRPLLTVLQPYR